MTVSDGADHVPRTNITALLACSTPRRGEQTHRHLLSAKEFRALVEARRLRSEPFYVIEIYPASRDDALRWLFASQVVVALKAAGDKQPSLGWLGRERLGILVQDVRTAEAIQDWAAAQPPEMRASRVYFHDIQGNSQEAKRNPPICDLYKVPIPRGKRCFDIAVGTLALVLASPLLCLSIALMKSSSRGPLFFIQDRVGHGGRSFRMYKLRTMLPDADGAKAGLLENNRMGGSAFKIQDDPRITWAGKWLRRFSIDEIPQLWNVIRGDMSLVGPRPLPSADWAPVSLRECMRHDVIPGLTCIWQIRGRNEIGWKDWVRMDLYYVRKRCWALDMKILLATIPAVVSQRGAF